MNLTQTCGLICEILNFVRLVLARPLSDFNGLQYARNTASVFYRGT